MKDTLAKEGFRNDRPLFGTLSVATSPSWCRFPALFPVMNRRLTTPQRLP